ncbi:hypothetical protein [Roseobacter sp. N2S]|uniref:hypothetical protein n=1 Tax=Roseobacter sp. N2S TaxID=2663844 RepID=UPI00285BBC1B|nr:hypothetical protein [Roseobacter sp. N2S]MDR6267055.1 uncharacterized membrane protein YciS (DUF1049 family) [Roseobacter sp. N2S]
MTFTIGTLVIISFAVSLAALVVLIWAISKSQMRFTQEDACTIFRVEQREEGLDDPSVNVGDATQPTDAAGNAYHPADSRRVILFMLGMATLWLIVGSTFGLIASCRVALNCEMRNPTKSTATLCP